MHSTNNENIGLTKPGELLQSENDRNQCCVINNLKRKSYYELTAASAVIDDQQHSPPSTKIFKHSYEHQLNNHHHHICNGDDENNVGLCGNTTDYNSSVIIDTTTLNNDDDDEHEHMEFIDKYIVDHSNGTVELVNIMFDNNHLIPPVVDAQQSSAVMTTDGNYINYTSVDDNNTDTSSWTNVELLDLDQRGYYYSSMDAQPTVAEESIILQEKQSAEVTTTVPS